MKSVFIFLITAFFGLTLSAQTDVSINSIGLLFSNLRLSLERYDQHYKGKTER